MHSSRLPTPPPTTTDTEPSKDVGVESTPESKKLSKSQQKRMMKKVAKASKKAGKEEDKDMGIESGVEDNEMNSTMIVEDYKQRDESDKMGEKDENDDHDDHDPQQDEDEFVPLSMENRRKKSVKNILDVSEIVKLGDDGFVYGGYLYKKSKKKTLLSSKWSNRFVSVNTKSGLLMVFTDMDSYDESGQSATSIAGLRDAKITFPNAKESGREFSLELHVKTVGGTEEGLTFATINENVLAEWSDLLSIAIGDITVEDSGVLNDCHFDEGEMTESDTGKNMSPKASQLAEEQNSAAEELKVATSQEFNGIGSPELLVIPSENGTNTQFSPVSMIVDVDASEIQAPESTKIKPDPPVNKPGSRPPPPPSPRASERRSKSSIPIMIDYPDPKPHLSPVSPENSGHYGYRRESEVTTDQRTYHGNLDNPNPDIWTRSNIILAAREKMRDTILLEREADLRHVEEGMQPHINKRSHYIKRNTSDMFEWENNRVAKIKQKIKEKEADATKGITGKPELIAKRIHRHSKKMPDGSVVVDYGYDEAGREAVPFYERLHAVQAERDAKRKQEDDDFAKQMRHAKPKINKSPELKTGQRVAENITERLYCVHNDLMKKREQAKKLQDVLEYVPPAPKLSENSIKIANKERPEDVPIEDLLAYKGKLYEQKAQIRQALKDHNEIMKRKQAVALNKTSQKIVNDKSLNSSAHTGNSMNDSIWDYENRLYKPTGEVKQSIILDIKNPSYQPKINPKSSAILRNNPQYQSSWRPNSVNVNTSTLRNNQSLVLDGTNTIFNEAENTYFYSAPSNSPGRFSLNSTTLNHTLQDTSHDDAPNVVHRSLHWAKERERKLEREREEREREVMQECSFKPHFYDKKRASSAVMSRTSSNGNLRASAEEIVEKNNAWLKKREQKLAAERRKKEDSALDGCTFAPKIPKINDAIYHAHSKIDDHRSSSRLTKKNLDAAASTAAVSVTENLFTNGGVTIEDVALQQPNGEGNNTSENSGDMEKKLFLKHMKMSAASEALNDRLDTESVPVIKRHMQNMTQGFLDLSHNERKERLSDWLVRENTKEEAEKLETFRNLQGEKSNDSVMEQSVDDEPMRSPEKSVGFKDSIYEMKTITVNKEEIIDRNNDEVIATAVDNMGEDIIDHPYYSEDLFVNATYPTDTNAEHAEPPPPPPKSPPPQKAKKKQGLDRDQRRKSIERKTQFL